MQLKEARAGRKIALPAPLLWSMDRLAAAASSGRLGEYMRSWATTLLADEAALCDLVLACVQVLPRARPSMEEVYKALKDIACGAERESAPSDTGLRLYWLRVPDSQLRQEEGTNANTLCPTAPVATRDSSSTVDYTQRVPVDPGRTHFSSSLPVGRTVALVKRLLMRRQCTVAVKRDPNEPYLTRYPIFKVPNLTLNLKVQSPYGNVGRTLHASIRVEAVLPAADCFHDTEICRVTITRSTDDMHRTDVSEFIIFYFSLKQQFNDSLAVETRDYLDALDLRRHDHFGRLAHRSSV